MTAIPSIEEQAKRAQLMAYVTRVHADMVLQGYPSSGIDCVFAATYAPSPAEYSAYKEAIKQAEGDRALFMAKKAVM